MTPAYETKGEEARDVAVLELGKAIDKILRQMSVSGRLVDTISKSKILKQARKTAARKGKAIRKSAGKAAKRARKSATKAARKAGKTAKRQARKAVKKARKAARRRRRK
jgi:adenylate kinase